MSDVYLPEFNADKQPTVLDKVVGLPDAPIHAERHIKVICIGAGASGLLFAYKLQRSFYNFDLTIYEKNEDIAGTWYENRYPGCACDIPAHTYVWSFEPKTDWSSVYAGSSEIYQYFDNFSRKYDLRKYCKMQHQVIGATWDDDRGVYIVKVKDLASGKETIDYCNILVNAGGILNAWRYPAIPGLNKYKGTLLHTAAWDNSVDLSGKVVGLIGNGSSGIQVLPTIQPHVDKVITFIREPTYVSPVQGLSQHVYTADEKKQFTEQEGTLTKYRKQIERDTNKLFNLFIKDTPSQKENRAYITGLMKEKIANPYLEERLIPEWSLGCRRLTPGIGYLESLSKPNVEVVYGEITEITEKGCICDNGQEYPVDVLICATGFDTSFRPRFPVIGPNKKNLQDVWGKQPHSYLGLAAAEFPNYLVFLGPNCPIGNGPVLIAIEAQADWMMSVIDRYQTTNIHSFSPKQEAVDDFIEYKDKFMQKTIWSEPCRSWYKGAEIDAPITALWPGSTLHYLEALNQVRWEDFNVRFNGNRFAWLGNGYSQTELDPLADTAYYIREKDDSPPASTRAKREALTRTGEVGSTAPRRVGAPQQQSHL
ncbi:hypothetical protein Z517_02851 [Fonsecaea pedrosoi CBS 271.37]|uniref:FAD/NAD(P)-binding domain-containing protein n=1 Tax=Fonsecaea pedrosoi CBS 271.37 TaxID=1442368 RepID=A0A0D2GYA3_9EURO|nr:uncharacterized protein Z517_02851 [Fonsecaea pedrosoi CBS 271.37]KIW83605.1 hypothetical protein Z517_02851 [Fonsecaea pedrosoi CBS 271.37]